MSAATSCRYRGGTIASAHGGGLAQPGQETWPGCSPRYGLLHHDSGYPPPRTPQHPAGEWQTIAAVLKPDTASITATPWPTSVLSLHAAGHLSIPVVAHRASLPMAPRDGMNRAALAAASVPKLFWLRQVIAGCRAVKTATDFDAFERQRLAANGRQGLLDPPEAIPPPPGRAPCGTSCATRYSSSSSRTRPGSSTCRSRCCRASSSLGWGCASSAGSIASSGGRRAGMTVVQPSASTGPATSPSTRWAGLWPG